MIDLKLNIPEDFLKEEVRCDYLVTAKMKEAWAVMLDLLVEFDRVCKKHNIQYFANGGTFLGAIRHKGFIPWDDDVDLMMTRENYNKLLAVAEEFQHPYFLQNKYSDPCCRALCSKLRNSNTTAFEKEEVGTMIKYNKGVFIDIFPLDCVPDDEAEKKQYLQDVWEAKQQLFSLGKKLGIYAADNRQPQKFVKETLYKLLSKRREHKVSLYKEKMRNLESVLDRYNHLKTKYFYIFSFDYVERNLKSKSFYNEIIEVPFEFIKIPVASRYDEALTETFGDWRKLVKGTSYHSEIFFDTDKSYLEYEK